MPADTTAIHRVELGFTFFFKPTSPVSDSDPQYGTTAGWRVGVPHWFPMLLAAVLQAVTLSRLWRRDPWRLVMACSALSLLVCVAVCVLWVRTYVAPVTVRLSADRRDFPVATSAAGAVVVRTVSHVDSWTE